MPSWQQHGINQHPERSVGKFEARGWKTDRRTIIHVVPYDRSTMVVRHLSPSSVVDFSHSTAHHHPSESPEWCRGFFWVLKSLRRANRARRCMWRGRQALSSPWFLQRWIQCLVSSGLFWHPFVFYLLSRQRSSTSDKSCNFVSIFWSDNGVQLATSLARHFTHVP
jgi:hypothetical protein